MTEKKPSEERFAVLHVQIPRPEEADWYGFAAPIEFQSEGLPAQAQPGDELPIINQDGIQVGTAVVQAGGSFTVKDRRQQP